LELLKKFLEANDLSGLHSKPVFRGVHLRNWVMDRRARYVKGLPQPEWLMRELEALPDWSWTPKADRQHLRRLSIDEEREDRRDRAGRHQENE
jgi:hypothetical protein